MPQDHRYLCQFREWGGHHFITNCSFNDGDLKKAQTGPAHKKCPTFGKQFFRSFFDLMI